ncbi:hypothetical protein TNCV_3598821 [Trichonephila clavipes]|nr:hypothetical protein TNCV_3598821 [Trichonephila clavipes]
MPCFSVKNRPDIACECPKPGGEIKAQRIGRARRRQRNEGPFSCYKRNTLPWSLTDEMRDGERMQICRRFSLLKHKDGIGEEGRGLGKF